MTENNTESDIEEFKNKKKDFQKSFIILIGFGFFFLFFIFLPYSSIQNARNEYQESKPLANNISALSNTTERIFTLTSNMNNLLGTLKKDVTNRYSELTNYFAQLESMESGLISGRLTNYTSVGSDYSAPTFLSCSSMNVRDLIYCDARIMANNTANKVLYNVQEVVDNKLNPLENEAIEEYSNFQTFTNNIENMATIPISKNSFNNTLCITKMSIKNNSFFRNINPLKACDFVMSVNNITVKFNANEAKIKQIGKDVLYKGDGKNSAWNYLKDPEILTFYVASGKLPDFSSILKDTREQNNELQAQLQNLRVKFEQIEIPFIGKLPVTIESSIFFFPTVFSIGFVVCCYLINSAITIRTRIHKELGNKFEETMESNFIKPEYLWIQPEVLLPSQKKTCKFMKYYLPLIIFIGAPITFCSLGLYLIHSLLSSESGLYLEDILHVDYQTFYIILLIVLFSIGLGIYLVLKKLWVYDKEIKAGIEKKQQP
jgi:hypothetical protein